MSRLAVALLFFAACATRPPTIQLTGCKAGDLAARCGTLLRPESPGSPRMLSMKVIVVPAEVHNDSAIVLLAGGPGDTVLEGAPRTKQFFPKLHERHDFVFMDERGAGQSAPLECPKTTAKYQRAFVEGELFPEGYARDCRAEIAPHADLAAYTYPNFVDDLEALRVALGYGPVDLMGLSYGSRAALTYLQRHPQAVRSLVLVGPVAPEDRTPLFFSRDAQAALDRLVAACAADAACHAAFPRFDAELRTVFATSARASIGAGALGEWLRTRLYSTESAAAVPLLIHRAAAGDWQPLAADFARYRKEWYSGTPLYLAVTCPSDTRHIDPNDIAAATGGSLFGDYRVRRQLAACAEWAPGLEPFVEVPRDSHVPAILISGDADPVTPAVWGDDVARRLGGDARVIVLPNTAHGDISPCLFDLITRFIDDPAPGRLDIGCTRAHERPPFATQ
jgi:pimeloyl-ACP methyl ester carboxylesterase